MPSSLIETAKLTVGLTPRPIEPSWIKDGAHARWHVEGRVKKLAFCRKTQPVWLGFALRVFPKCKKILMPAGAGRPASLMGAG